MKILIIGAGAIGGSLACYLHSENLDITILEKNPEVREAINRDGVVLRDGESLKVAKVKAVGALGEEKYDCCFSATRAYHLKDAVLSVLPNLNEDAPVISMNNGVCIEPLLEAVGEQRAVWCAINYGAGIEGLGKYFIKIHGDVVMGTLRGITHDLIRLKDELQGDLEFNLTDNVVGALYSKMLINSCITSTAVVSGLTLGEILGRRSGKKVFLEILREGVRVAKRAGIKIPNYRGMNYYVFTAKNPFSALYRAIVFPVLKKKYGQRTSATLDAMKKGVKSEIDYFNGYVVSLGKKHGEQTIYNQALVDCVKSVEENFELISADRLTELASVRK